MRLTVIQWNTVQESCFQNQEDRGDVTFIGSPQQELWRLIEDRTFGKRWTQQVAIRLTKEQEQYATAALDAAAQKE